MMRYRVTNLTTNGWTETDSLGEVGWLVNTVQRFMHSGVEVEDRVTAQVARFGAVVPPGVVKGGVGL